MATTAKKPARPAQNAAQRTAATPARVAPQQDAAALPDVVGVAAGPQTLQPLNAVLSSLRPGQTIEHLGAASWTEVPVHTRPGFVTTPKGLCPQPPVTLSAQAAERMRTMRNCALGGMEDTLLAMETLRLPPEVGTYKAALLEWLEQGRANEQPT